MAVGVANAVLVAYMNEAVYMFATCLQVLVDSHIHFAFGCAQIRYIWYSFEPRDMKIDCCLSVPRKVHSLRVEGFLNYSLLLLRQAQGGVRAAARRRLELGHRKGGSKIEPESHSDNCKEIR